MTGGGTITTDTRWRSRTPRNASTSKRGSVTTFAPAASAEPSVIDEPHHVRERRQREHDVVRP